MYEEFLVLEKNGTFDVSDTLWYNCPIPLGKQADIDNQDSDDQSGPNVLAIALPTTVGGVVFFVVLVIISILTTWCLLSKRRRKYIDVKDLAEPFLSNGVEMQETKLYDYREIDINDIRMGKQLGRGAFGRVFKVSTLGLY